MIAGTGKPRIRCYIEEEMISIDFTPAKFFLMTDKDPISANLIRNAVRSVERKIFIKGKYLSLKYRFYNLTYAEITVLKKLRSRTGLFTPHLDYDKDYYAIFESVKALPEKDLMDRYFVEIVIRSVNYQEYAVMNTGFYSVFGANEHIETPTHLPTEFTLTMMYRRKNTFTPYSALAGYGDLYHSMKIEITADGRLLFGRRKYEGGIVTEIQCFSYNGTIPINAWGKIEVQRRQHGSVYLKYNDELLDLDIAGGSDSQDMTDTFEDQILYIGKTVWQSAVNYMGVAEYKNIVAKDKTVQTLLDYHCSEPAVSGTYEGYTKDWSFQGQDGTPVNFSENNFNRETS
jgi:hypothetical protein